MGTLYIVSTPIGNMEDITLRAIKTLSNVDYILCEDTRKTGLLLQGIRENYTSIIRINEAELKKPKLISYYDEIELKRIPEIIDLLFNGNDIALVSDNGTPLISDPGFKIIKECIKRGIKITSIPGPSSVITGLIVSGLPPNDFRFIGYLPDNKTRRQKLLKNILNAIRPDSKPYTIIAFEVPHRLKNSLEDINEVLGDIEIVICRELTKIHEEVWRGRISETMNKDFKGELIILFSRNV